MVRPVIAVVGVVRPIRTQPQWRMTYDLLHPAPSHGHHAFPHLLPPSQTSHAHHRPRPRHHLLQAIPNCLNTIRQMTCKNITINKSPLY